MRTNHRYYQEMVSALADDELDGRRSQELERHLAACSECRSLLRELKALHGVMRSQPQADIPPYFLTRLHARLEQKETVLDPITQLARSLIPILSILTVLLMIVSFLVPEDPLRSPDDYYLANRTPIEQRVLTQKKSFTGDEILMIAMSSERNGQQ